MIYGICTDADVMVVVILHACECSSDGSRTPTSDVDSYRERVVESRNIDQLAHLPLTAEPHIDVLEGRQYMFR